MFSQGFTCPDLLSNPQYLEINVPYGLSPTMASLSRLFQCFLNIEFRLFRFRSPLLPESRLISFPAATEMFQFAAFASIRYVFTHGSS